MPIVEINVVEGRDQATLRRLISNVTHAVASSLKAPVGSVRVIVREVPATHWAAGDVTIQERE
jgi:4-oxalocrotonate tautomerase